MTTETRTDEDKLARIEALEEGIWGALERGGLDPEWLYRNIASLESCQNIREHIEAQHPQIGTLPA